MIAVHERRDVLRRERRAAHGGRLHHGPVALVQTVEARRQQRLDRVGERLRAALEGRREQLLDEERVALGDGQDVLARRRVESLVGGEPIEQRL